MHKIRTRYLFFLSFLFIFLTIMLYTNYVLNDSSEANEVNPTHDTQATPDSTSSPTSSDDSASSPVPTSPSTDLIEEDMPSIDMIFTGDVMMDDAIGEYITKFGVDYPWTDVAPILKSADVAAVNLETSVSTRGVTYKPKGFGFRSHPTSVQGLVNSGIDFVSLANNHAFDFGRLALIDTIDTLDASDIAHTGAGLTLNDAEKLTLIQRKNLTIGFLSYSSIIPNEQWIAQMDSPGIAALKPEFVDRILNRIHEADLQCDLLIVTLHWGIEYSDQVEEWQRELAKRMIDEGADVIVGHHPHVLRGMEVYHNKPIFYSTGNFVFLKRDENAGKTALFKVTMNREGFVSGAILPVYIQYGKANLLNAQDAMRNEIIAHVRKLSEPLGTQMTDQGTFSAQLP